MNYPNIKEITIIKNSKYDCILVHGYTGSPQSFNGLPEALSEKLNVSVYIPLLKGHGTNVRDLDNITYNDFYTHIEQHVKESLKKGKKIILMGFSFGCLIAADIATRYPIEGIIFAAPLYAIQFPARILPMNIIKIFKPTWKKQIKTREYDKIDGYFYPEMHVNAITIYQQTITRFRKNLPKIKIPALIIHSQNDNLSTIKNNNKLYNKLGTIQKTHKIYPTNYHNIFYSDIIKELETDTITFIKNIINPQEKKASAIICAYNEEKNILSALNALNNTQKINEIIIVNDGSCDNTHNIITQFLKEKTTKKIIYLNHNKNKGKGASMEEGVQNSQNEYILFTDADLKGIKAEHYDSIIEPVINVKSAMNLGIRSNKLQHVVKFVEELTGERALTKKLWKETPNYYKQKFRIEAGLNYYCKKKYHTYTKQEYPYYQTLKEEKYGFFIGIIQRIKMYFDVLSAWIGCLIYDKFKN